MKSKIKSQYEDFYCKKIGMETKIMKEYIFIRSAGFIDSKHLKKLECENKNTCGIGKYWEKCEYSDSYN